jgi:hypothetical protein
LRHAASRAAGQRINIGLDALNKSLNRKLTAAKSDFSEIQIGI